MEFQHYHNGHELLNEILDSNTSYIDDQFDQNTLIATPTTFDDFSALPFVFDQQTLNCSTFGQHFINPFFDHDQLHVPPHLHIPNIKLESSPLFDQDYYSMFSLLDNVENNDFVHDGDTRVNNLEMPDLHGVMDELEPDFKMGKKCKNSKVEGQPSKNLMAERRRRKRLNDRLSMLRSVVPKISKMDRTSILGDTIEYMKELINKINHMQEEMQDISSNQLNFMNSKAKEEFIRNSPKFNVERRNTDTRVQICCTSKPELLISTMTTLEALGLQIHQCVISCFNDFAMNASCSQEMEQKDILNSEDIKQALFRNAGYGGKCL